MRNARRLTEWLGAAGLFLSLAACAAAPVPPLQRPDIILGLNHFLGTPFSGPMVDPADDYPDLPSSAPPETSFSIRFAVDVARGCDTSSLSLVSTTAPMIAEPLSDAPLRPVNRLLPGVRAGLATGNGLLAGTSEHLPFSGLVGALDPGMTCVLSAATPQGAPRPLQLSVHRPLEGDTLLVGLVQRVFDEQDAAKEWEQLALASAPEVDGPALVVALPQKHPGDTMLIRVHVTRGTAGDEQHAAAVAEARVDARARHAELFEILQQTLAGVPDRTGLFEALSGLEQNDNRRGALLYLSTVSNSPVGLDLALVGRAELLDTISAQLRDTLGRHSPSLAEVAWLIERIALEELVRRIEDDDIDDPALEALLLRHAGEVGRDLTLLLGLLEEAQDVSHLHRLFIDENVFYLDDNAPASRVRAFDWLLSRDIYVTDYQPLVDRESRRRALDAFLETFDVHADAGADP